MKLLFENWREHTVSEGWFSRKRSVGEVRDDYLEKLLDFKDFKDLARKYAEFRALQKAAASGWPTTRPELRAIDTGREKAYSEINGVVIEFKSEYPEAEKAVPELRLGRYRKQPVQRGGRVTREKWLVDDLIDLYGPEELRINAPPGSLTMAEPEEGGGLSMADEEGGLSLQENIDFSTFKLKDTLEPNLWQKDELNPEIKEKLKEIALNFWEKTELKDVDVIDIIITGSTANYNWTEYSDIDLHIIIDLAQVDDNIDLVNRFFRYLSASWNRAHKIMIKGHEVEIYVQGVNEVHASTGMYSVLNGYWTVKPSKTKVQLDKEAISRKAEVMMEKVDAAEKMYAAGEYEEAHETAVEIKEKIRNMRKCGLTDGGEFSAENLAFKVLRRNGYLAKLSELKNDAYDHMMSLNGGCHPTAGIRIKIG